MREVQAFEAKNTLGTLLDLVEHGEEVVITRRGKPVARLIREPGRQDRTGTASAMSGRTFANGAPPAAFGYFCKGTELPPCDVAAEWDLRSPADFSR